MAWTAGGSSRPSAISGVDGVDVDDVDDDVALALTPTNTDVGPVHVRLVDDIAPLLPPPSTAGAGVALVDDDWQYIRIRDRSSSGEIIRTEALS
jgi:hypothetical protein